MQAQRNEMEARFGDRPQKLGPGAGQCEGDAEPGRWGRRGRGGAEWWGMVGNSGEHVVGGGMGVLP